MDVTISNHKLTVSDSSGKVVSLNIQYGRYDYNPTWDYIDIFDISDTRIQLKAGQIDKYNGVAGNPTYTQIIADIEAGI